MGFMKVISQDGVQDVEDMTIEEMMGLMVEFMKEEKGN